MSKKAKSGKRGGSTRDRRLEGFPRGAPAFGAFADFAFSAAAPLLSPGARDRIPKMMHIF